MLGYVAVTDVDWFRFLRDRPDLDEVNFWRPSDTRSPQQLSPGTPFFFKLRREHGDSIVGYGIFARHEVLPAYIAWDWFGEKNGASDFFAMRHRIEALRRDKPSGKTRGDYLIGCLMLAQPIFFADDQWVSAPASWPPNVVQGKAYDLDTGEGAQLWNSCRLAASDKLTRGGTVHVDPVPAYGAPTLIRPRLGQGIFRAAVTSAYDRACAVTGEHSLPVLEAAHIRPYAQGGRHEVRNGLLLRSDIHRLFDTGYVAVDPDLRFIVSSALKDDFENGRSYYPLHGRQIRVPSDVSEYPDRSHLTWHMENCFRSS